MRRLASGVLPDRLFLRHLGEDAPYVPTLLEGAKAVQLAELVYRSHAEGRWLDVPSLTV